MHPTQIAMLAQQQQAQLYEYINHIIIYKVLKTPMRPTQIAMLAKQQQARRPPAG